MNAKLEKIKKLRRMTQANGCSEGEEDSAARAIGRMLMEDDALILGDGSEPGVPFHVNPYFPPGSPWASAYQQSAYAAQAAQQKFWQQQQEAQDAMRDAMARAAKFAQDMRDRQRTSREQAQTEREELLRKMREEAANK